MYHFIVNPASCSGHGIEVWTTVESYLKETGTEYEVSFSKAHGDVAVLAGEISEAHLNDSEPASIIILGGDGTLDEALQGIKDFSKLNIGYIPTGSSNDFARALGYRKKIIETTKRVLSCKEPKIYDLGKLEYMDDSNERSRLHKGDVPKFHYFDVSCGIGFDASVCEEALKSDSKNFLNKIGLGKLTYLAICLRQVFHGVTPNATLFFEGVEPIEIKDLRFLVAMNTCYEGGGFKFAPNAVPDDGFLDICMASNLTPWQILGILPTAFKGNHVKKRQIDTYHTKSFEIKTSEPVWVHTDGEVYRKSAHIKVSVVPGILRFLY